MYRSYLVSINSNDLKSKLLMPCPYHSIHLLYLIFSVNYKVFATLNFYTIFCER